MADRARAIASQAAGVLGEARVAFHLLAQEDHASVLPVAISRALRFVLAED